MTQKQPLPAWLRRDTKMSKEERLRRMLEKEQQIIKKWSNHDDGCKKTSVDNNCVSSQTLLPKTTLDSDETLALKVAETRWHKTKDGRWSSKASVHGTAFLRMDSSNEAHCYKSLSTANYLPVQMLEDLSLSDAIDRDDDFLVACELSTILCVKYWTSCSQTSTQALLYQNIIHLYHRQKEIMVGFSSVVEHELHMADDGFKPRDLSGKKR